MMVSLLVKLCHKLNLVDCKKYFLSIQSGIFLGNIISADPQLEFMYMSLVSVSSDFESGIDSDLTNTYKVCLDYFNFIYFRITPQSQLFGLLRLYYTSL